MFAGQRYRGLPVQDAVIDVDTLGLEGFQFGDALYTRCRQQRTDVTRHLGVVVYPSERGIARGIDAVVADDGNLQVLGYLDDGLVELRGEGMGGIDEQTDGMVLTESQHRLGIEGTVQTCAVMEGDVLLACLRAVEIGTAALFQHFYGLAALGSSSKD